MSFDSDSNSPATNDELDAKILERLGEPPSLDDSRRAQMRFRIVRNARLNQGETSEGKPRLAWIAYVALAAIVALAVLYPWPSESTVPDVQCSLETEPGSEVHVAQSGPHQRLRLVQGSAWFEVTELLPEQSYIVSAGRHTIEVRGTRFRLQLREGELSQVSLVEGTIVLGHPDGRQTILTAPAEWENAEVASSGQAPPSVPPAQNEAVADEVDSDAELVAAADVVEETRDVPGPVVPSEAPAAGAMHVARGSRSRRHDRRRVSRSAAAPARPIRDSPPRDSRDPLEPDLREPEPETEGLVEPETQEPAASFEEPADEAAGNTIEGEVEGVDDLFASGWAALSRGENILARRAFERLARDPRADRSRRNQARYWVATALLREGNPERALSIVESLPATAVNSALRRQIERALASEND